MAQQPPLKEGPILIEYLHQEDHHHYDRSNTSAAERRPLAPAEVWLDMVLIPATPPAQTPFPGTLSAVVRGISGVALAPVPGSTIRFQPAVPGEFVDMVPANYNGGAYQPTLRDAAGTVIPYDPSVWVADGVRQLVEFKFRPPTELGYALPLNISYWRYVGAFPGPGAAGVTNGLNLGTGAQVWKDLLGTVMRFRTITAGPGLSLAQDLPTTDEIMVSADEVTPAGAPAVPATLDLYVSAAGNDTTGDGTGGNPYLTLQRAFRDIRVIGYDDSATVTILASGGPFALPTGILPLGQGTRGKRTLPVIVQGSGRTTVNAGLAVTAVVVEPGSSLQTVSVGAPPGVPFALGQVIRFTSGTLSGQSLWLAAPAATSFVLPSTAGVAPGDTFDVETLDTLVTQTGVTVVWGKGGVLSLQDLHFRLTGGAGILVFVDQNTLTTGVWLENTANACLLLNGAGVLTGGGLRPSAASGFVTSPHGLLATNLDPNKVFLRLAPEETACTASFTNSVFQGNGLPGNMTLNSPFLSLNQSYFGGFGTIRMLNHRADMSNLWFQDCVPNGPFFTISASGVVDVGNNAFLSLNNVSVYNSPHFGLRAFEDGCLAIGGNVHVEGCIDAGLYSDRGGHVVLTAAAANISWGAGNAGPGVWTFDHGRFTVMGLGGLDASGASTASHGILVEKGSSLRAPNLTANTNFIHGLHVADGSHVNVSGALVCNTNGKTGLWVECSKLVIGGALTANGNLTGGASAPLNIAGVVFTCSEVGIQGDVTVTGTPGPGPFGLGVIMQRTTLVVGSATVNANVNISGNNGQNVAVSGCRIDITGSLTCSGSVTSGGLAILESTFTVESGIGVPPGTITINGNNKHGLTVEASILEVNSVIETTIDANGSNGMTIGAGARCSFANSSNGCLHVTNSGAQGVTVLKSDLDVAGTLLMLANNDYNLAAAESRLRADTVISNSSTVGFGISLARSDADVFNDVTAQDNQGTNILMVGSRLRVGNALTSSGSVTGNGLTQSTGSELSAGTLTANDNTTSNIVLSDSALTVAGLLTASYPSGGPGAASPNIVVTRSVLRSQGLTAVDAVGGAAGATDMVVVTQGTVEVMGATTITSPRVGIVASNRSKVTIIGTTTITRVGALPTARSVTATNSDVEIEAPPGAPSVFSGMTAWSIGVFQGSSLRLTNAGISGAGGDALNVSRGSRAELQGVTGAGNSGVGLLVTYNSHVSFLAPTVTVTGAGGDCDVGANAVKTWAVMNAGVAADVNDYANATPQMCTAVPHP